MIEPIPKILNKDVAMKPEGTLCAWLPLSRSSMLPAFMSALFNSKDLFFSPLVGASKMYPHPLPHRPSPHPTHSLIVQNCH